MNYTTPKHLFNEVNPIKKSKVKLFSAFILFFLISSFASAQTMYDVVLGTNNKMITQVELEFNGNTITQNSRGTCPTPAQPIALHFHF